MKIFTHANCNDGFCAAWILSKIYPDADFIEVQYGINSEELFDKESRLCVDDRDVIIADFSFSREIMEKIERHSKSILCFDHHKTAEAELRGLNFCHFDLNRSGAKLVWDYFSEESLKWPQYIAWGMEELVEYIQDRDLWKWELENSREVSAAISSYPRDFKVWDGFLLMRISDLIKEGGTILRYQNQLVENLTRKPKIISFEGYSVPIVNSSLFQSEIGERLSADYSFVIIWFATEDKFVYSLRSAGKVDTSKIAKIHGGGGHPNAAGFSRKDLFVS